MGEIRAREVDFADLAGSKVAAPAPFRARFQETAFFPLAFRSPSGPPSLRTSAKCDRYPRIIKNGVLVRFPTLVSWGWECITPDKLLSSGCGGIPLGTSLPAEAERRAAAQAFIERHLHLVEPIADRARRHLPKVFERDDLIQAGRLGLVQAAYTYSAEAGLEENWANFSIRRAISNHVAGCNTRYPGREWMSPYQYEKDRRPLEEAPPAAPVSYDAAAEPKTDLEAAVQLATAELPPVQQKIIELKYDQGISLKSIARDYLKTRPKRVSEEHSKALRTLGGALTGRRRMEA